MIILNTIQFILLLIVFTMAIDTLILGTVFLHARFMPLAENLLRKFLFSAMIFASILITATTEPSTSRNVTIIILSVAGMLGLILTPNFSIIGILSKRKIPTMEKTRQNAIENIRSFIISMSATCMDISEEKIFNCPPDIAEGVFLNKVAIENDILVFYGEGYDSPTETIIDQNTISTPALVDVSEFINDYMDYIIKNATFS